MRVRVELDNCMQFYLDDEKYLSLVDPEGLYKTVEVPAELVTKYRKLQHEVSEMQQVLKEIWEKEFRQEI